MSTWLLTNSFAEIYDKLLGVSSRKRKSDKIDQTIQITEVWKYNLQKCIDGSPLLLNNKIYIGSHSGIFVCLNVLVGSVYWGVKLDDRIEATAAYINALDLVCIG